MIADSFNVRFAPITENKPRALLPLANTALLDYTLEFLCSSGIQQIIVFCCIHADQIKAHLRSSKWTSSTSPCEISTITSEDCLSVGDALRDIDARGLIKSDFILVNGDLVSNMQLKPVLEQHKARRLKEKTPVMTMVFQQASPGHPARCREEEVILGVKTDNSRILHYQKVANAKKFDFPLAMFQEHTSVQLRHDLLDCHISICSPIVPQLFTENFDYQTREHMIKGVLVNEEILGNTIHLHVLEESYAARVSNLHMYDAISRDVLSRWSHPMVPDCNITGHADNVYSMGRHNIYTHKDVSLARGCKLHENVVIGKGTCVGQNTQIRHSVIGRNCLIGENVSLDGVYVWDHVQIEDNCNVVTSVLANGVHVLPNTTVKSRCILAQEVKIGPDITLPAGKVLMSSPPTDSFDDPIEGHTEVLPGLVGAEGVAYEYAAPPESDEELEELSHDLWALEVASEEDDVSESEDESDEEDNVSRSPPPDDARMFYEEAINTLIRGEEENIEKDNLVLEINSLKCAYYMQIHEVIAWVSRALLVYPFKVNPDLQPNQYLPAFTKVIKRFLSFLKNYVRSAESQKDCINAIEEQCLASRVIGTSLPKILHILYNTDVLEEEAILTWYAKSFPDADDQAQRTQLRQQVTPFINWLNEADEESDEESD